MGCSASKADRNRTVLLENYQYAAGGISSFNSAPRVSRASISMPAADGGLGLAAAAGYHQDFNIVSFSDHAESNSKYCSASNIYGRINMQGFVDSVDSSKHQLHHESKMPASISEMLNLLQSLDMQGSDQSAAGSQIKPANCKSRVSILEDLMPGLQKQLGDAGNIFMVQSAGIRESASSTPYRSTRATATTSIDVTNYIQSVAGTVKLSSSCNIQDSHQKTTKNPARLNLHVNSVMIDQGADPPAAAAASPSTDHNLVLHAAAKTQKSSKSGKAKFNPGLFLKRRIIRSRSESNYQITVAATAPPHEPANPGAAQGGSKRFRHGDLINILTGNEAGGDESGAGLGFRVSSSNDDHDDDALERFEPLCPPGGEKSVVLYTTSLRGIRKTFDDCSSVRRVLQSLRVKVDERDVAMDPGWREELKQLMAASISEHAAGLSSYSVPRIFISGRYIGGAERFLRLHEDGELLHLLQGLPRLHYSDHDSLAAGGLQQPCDGCGDARFLPCLQCSGSTKLRPRHCQDIIRCPDCNENGLIQCPICSAT